MEKSKYERKKNEPSESGHEQKNTEIYSYIKTPVERFIFFKMYLQNFFKKII